ncbi:MAG: NAD(P)H-binding protein [Bacteroidota bacterium]
MNKKALLIGATGLTGQECLNMLLKDEYYSAVGIWVRRSTGMVHEKLVEKIIDFDKLHQADCTRADHLFCCLGTTIGKAGSQAAFTRIDRDYVVECGRIADKSDTEKFLYVSSLGANKDSGNFYLRTKGKVEESLRQMSIPAVIIFRPSMLLGNRSEFRLGEKIGKGVMAIFQFMLVGSLRKYRGVQASQVAKAMINEAKSKNDNGFRIIESDRIQEY